MIDSIVSVLKENIVGICIFVAIITFSWLVTYFVALPIVRKDKYDRAVKNELDKLMVEE